jgi:hypothetical protein
MMYWLVLPSAVSAAPPPTFAVAAPVAQLNWLGSVVVPQVPLQVA